MKTGGTMNFLKRTGAILLLVAVFASSCNKYADDFKQVNTKLDALATQVASISQVSTDLAAVKASIASLQTAIAAQPTSTAQAAQFAAVAAQLTAMTTAVASLDAQIKAVVTAGSATKAVVDGLKTDLAALSATVATNNVAAIKAASDAMAKLTTNSADIAALKTQLATMAAADVLVAADVAAIKTGVAANTTAIATNAAALTVQAGQITALAIQLTAFATASGNADVANAAAAAAAAAANAIIQANTATALASLTTMAGQDVTDQATTNAAIAALNVLVAAQKVQLDQILLNQVSPLTAVTIDNTTPQVGSVLTAFPVTALGATTSATYQWYVGGTAVAGATTNKYTVVAADLAKSVVVKATGTGNALSTEKSSASTTIVAPGTPLTLVTFGYGAPLKNPGVAIVGGLLTVLNTNITPNTTAVTYQWESSATAGGTYTAIAGATASKYYPVIADATMFIRVTITGTGAFTGTISSAPSAAVIYPVPLTSIALAAVVPQIGVALTAGAILPYAQPTSTGSPSETSLGNPMIATYQWQSSSDGGATFTDIAGATGPTYTPLASDLGYFFRVKAIGKSFTYGTVVSSATSAAVYPQAITAMAAPTGTPAYGSTLTAGATTPLTVAGTGATYQWQSAGVPIFGATGTAYVLKASDVGNVITVVATGQNGFFGTVTSVPTGAIVMANVASVAFTTVGGANNVVINLTGGTFTAAPVIGTFLFGGANAVSLGAVTVNRVSSTQVILTNVAGVAAAGDNTVTVLASAMATQGSSVAATANLITPVVSAAITPTVGHTKLVVTLTGGSFKPAATLAISDFTFAGFNGGDITALNAGTVSKSGNVVTFIPLAAFANATAGTVTVTAAGQATQGTSVAGTTAP